MNQTLFKALLAKVVKWEWAQLRADFPKTAKRLALRVHGAELGISVCENAKTREELDLIILDVEQPNMGPYRAGLSIPASGELFRTVTRICEVMSAFLVANGEEGVCTFGSDAAMSMCRFMIEINHENNEAEKLSR